MNTARTLFASSVARTLFLVLNIIVSFFMMPFIIRHLGDHWYGIWVIIGSFAGYYYLLDFGLASAVTRYVTEHIERKNHDAANTIINTSLVIYTMIAIIIIFVTVVIIAFAEWFIKSPEDLRLVQAIISIIGINMALEFPFKAFAGIIQAYLRYDLLTYGHFVSFALSTLAVLYFLSRGYGILSLAIITLISNQLSNVLFYITAKYLYKPIKVRLKLSKKSEAKNLFSYSVWAFIIQIANQMRFRVDTLIIGGIISASAVTHYFIGARLVDYFKGLLLRATNMMTPVFIKYYARGDMASIREKLLFITRINTVLAIFGGGLIIILGKAFIIRWMGNDYSDAYPVLVALMIAMIVEVIVNPLDNMLYAISRHSFLAKINLAEGILKFFLSLVLIRYYGFLGVALATTAPLLVTRLVVLPVFACKQINLTLKRYFYNLVGTMLFSVCYLAMTYFLAQPHLTPPSYLSIILIALLTVPIYIFVTLFITFSKAERHLLLTTIRGY